MAIGQWNSNIDLIHWYKRTRRDLEQTKRAVKEQRQVDNAAWLETLGALISNCDYAIKQMHAEKDRQRNVTPWDPEWFETYRSPNGGGWSVHRESNDLSNHDRFRIEEAMRDLSVRERQCYLLHYVDGMSLSDIGMELHMAKGSVQVNLRRACAKIEDAKVSSLFLVE